MTLPASITPNADGTYTVAGVAVCLTEAEAFALLTEVYAVIPTATPICEVNASRDGTVRWERVA